MINYKHVFQQLNAEKYMGNATSVLNGCQSPPSAHDISALLGDVSAPARPTLRCFIPLRWIPYSQTLMTNSWSRTYHHRKWAILSTTLPMRRLWFPINYYKYYYKRGDKSWTSFKFEVWLFLIDTESEMYILYNKNDFITTVLLFKPPCIVLICSRVVQMWAILSTTFPNEKTMISD